MCSQLHLLYLLMFQFILTTYIQCRRLRELLQTLQGTDTGYTVVYSIENKMAVFTITLDPSLAEYEEEIRLALEVHFASASDVIIIVQVE